MLIENCTQNTQWQLGRWAELSVCIGRDFCIIFQVSAQNNKRTVCIPNSLFLKLNFKTKNHIMIRLEMKTTGSRLSTAQINQRNSFLKNNLINQGGRSVGTQKTWLTVTGCGLCWCGIIKSPACFHPWVVLKTGTFPAFSSIMAQDKGCSWIWTLLEWGQDSWTPWGADSWAHWGAGGSCGDSDCGGGSSLSQSPSLTSRFWPLELSWPGNCLSCP